MTALTSQTSNRPTAGTERLSLVAQAYQAISRGILEGRYAPGQRLIEADLTQELGISRNTLREALHRLTANGMVQIEAFRGAIVASPTRKEVMDLLAVRGRLESFAARCAASRMHLPGVRERAEQAARPLLAEAESLPKLEEHLRENRQFHDLILQLADNTSLLKVIDQLYLPVHMRTFFRLYDVDLYNQSMSDHREIFAAILAGDEDLAERMALKHVNHTRELMDKLPDSFFKAG